MGLLQYHVSLSLASYILQIEGSWDLLGKCNLFVREVRIFFFSYKRSLEWRNVLKMKNLNETFSSSFSDKVMFTFAWIGRHLLYNWPSQYFHQNLISHITESRIESSKQ